MHIVDFSLDIWKHIIEHGGLDVSDVLNLMASCKPLAETLRHDLIWYALLYEKYIKVMQWFDLDRAKLIIEQRTSNNEKVNSYFDHFMSFYKKDKKFKGLFLPKTRDLRYYLDMFSDDEDYLPIVYNKYYELEKDYKKLIADRKKFHIDKLGVCLNLIQVYSFRIGVNNVAKIIKHGSVLDSQTVEKFWFYVSLMDPNAFEIVQYRSMILDKIFKRLHTEITEKVIYSSLDDIKLIINEHSKDVLMFKDEDVLIDFILHIFKVVLSCLKFKNPLIPAYDHTVWEEYEEAYFLEDMSILRMYSGQVKGHPLLIISLLYYIIEEFLTDKYDLRLPDCDEPQDLKLNYFAELLKVRNVLITFDRRDISLSNDFETFPIQDMRQHLGLKAITASLVFDLPKADWGDMVRAYLNIRYINSCKSMSLIIEPEDHIFGSNMSLLNNVLYGMIPYGTYHFIRLVLTSLKGDVADAETFDSQFLKDLKDLLSDTNEFIHFKTVYELFDDSPLKQQQIKDLFIFDSFTFLGNLSIPCMRLAEIVSYQERYDPTVSYSTEHNGFIVKHNKFDEYGIIVNQRINGLEDRYYIVYTTKRNFEIYSRESVSIVDANTKKLPELLNFIMKSCGEDNLIIMGFKRIFDMGSTPRLIGTLSRG